MGCAHSSIKKEETVQRCKERRRLMKLLMSRRAELAASHLAYLQSLRNTGATLRQFTEVESFMIPGNSPLGLQLPPSPPPPPPLPPSPPLPPHFSPQTRKVEGNEELSEEDSVGIVDDDDSSCSPPPPPPVQGPAWEFWEPFGPPSSSNSSSSAPEKDGGMEDEDWAEAHTEFMEEEEGKEAVCSENVVFDLVKEKPFGRDIADDTSSAVSLMTKDTDMAVVVWRSKKSLAGIVKEIDDYFLKAAAGGNDLVVLLEANRGHRLDWSSEEIKGKSSKSAKVFSALSWNRSFKSPQSSRGAHCQEASNASSPCNHCTTLEKIYAAEQRLYKEVKEEELAKVLHKKKTLLVNKLESRNHEYTKTEEMRSSIESLQSQILSLQESINGTCLSISKLRDEELHPQLTQLIFGLMRMWRTMYECHQVQNHIALQATLLDRHPGLEPTTDSHHFATAQLESEVTSWYNSFCNLLRSQRDYVQILNQWIGLTDCLPDTHEVTSSACGIRALCEEWQLALNRLPDKVAAEAIKSFVSVIHSIILQQSGERKLKKKSDQLESRLTKELASLSDSGNHEEENNTVGNPVQDTKLEALRKRVVEEKAKYTNSIRISRAMTLDNLQTSLPNVFQALMGFAGVCLQALEGICRPTAATSTGATSTVLA